jgi:hypothetical protein
VIDVFAEAAALYGGKHRDEKIATAPSANLVQKGAAPVAKPTSPTPWTMEATHTKESQYPYTMEATQVFEPTGPNMLQVHLGQSIQVLEKHTSGWLYCKNMATGKKGWSPFWVVHPSKAQVMTVAVKADFEALWVQANCYTDETMGTSRYDSCVLTKGLKGSVWARDDDGNLAILFQGNGDSMLWVKSSDFGKLKFEGGIRMRHVRSDKPFQGTALREKPKVESYGVVVNANEEVWAHVQLEDDRSTIWAHISCEKGEGWIKYEHLQPRSMFSNPRRQRADPLTLDLRTLCSPK